MGIQAFLVLFFDDLGSFCARCIYFHLDYMHLDYIHLDHIQLHAYCKDIIRD